jgi:hypothetical protein
MYNSYDNRYLPLLLFDTIGMCENAGFDVCSIASTVVPTVFM